MKFAIGADHRGFEMKEYIKETLFFPSDTIEWLDEGAYDNQRSDYPIFVQKVCKAILAGKARYGILLCGSGVGMSVAANRFKGIYAALVWNDLVARMSKEDDNANILVIPADYVTPQQAVSMILQWYNATFKGGRYAERLAMIEGK